MTALICTRNYHILIFLIPGCPPTAQPAVGPVATAPATESATPTASLATASIEAAKPGDLSSLAAECHR